MAIKTAEQRRIEQIAEKDAEIAALETQLAIARLEAERWQAKYLDSARVWPAVTIAAAVGLIGFGLGLVV